MSHGDLVTKVPEGFETVGTSKDCPIASIQDTTRNFMVSNSMQKYVIPNTESNCCATLPLMFVTVKVTGQWITLSICK